MTKTNTDLYHENQRCGMIEPDSLLGKLLGFTLDNFSSESYLWVYISPASQVNKDTIWVSKIVGSNSAYCQLIDNLIETDWTIIVPHPLELMKPILTQNGFVKSVIQTKYGVIEVWKNK